MGVRECGAGISQQQVTQGKKIPAQTQAVGVGGQGLAMLPQRVQLLVQMQLGPRCGAPMTAAACHPTGDGTLPWLWLGTGFAERHMRAGKDFLSYQLLCPTGLILPGTPSSAFATAAQLERARGALRWLRGTCCP